MISRTFRPRLVSIAAAGLIAVGAGACGSSGHAATSSQASTGSGSPTAAAAAKVRIVNFTFSPMSVTVKVGGTVTWTQVDSVGHSVESTTNAWTTSNVLQPGQTFSHVFTKAGTYPYICGVHTYMKGSVHVVG